MSRNLYDLTELRLISECWPKIPEDAVPEKKRHIFCNRRSAVEMYIGGATLYDIENKCGVNRSVLMQTIKNALSTDPNGQFYGEAAFIPYQIKNRTNDSLLKGSGRFNVLLTTYPELGEFIMGNYYGNKKYTLEHNMNFVTLHNKFLTKCKELGIQDYEYPFNTGNLGYVSMIHYIKDTSANDIKNAVYRESKDVQQKVMSTGHGKRYSQMPLAPFQKVQVDGHIIDLAYNVQVDNGDGSISKVMATRPWVFVVIDMATRCILGYSVSQEFNYNQYDVLRAVRNSIEPHQKMTFKISGFEYPENGGYPSLAYPCTEYAVFSQIMLDNAKSHLAINTINNIVDAIGCSMNFGSVATPETRGIVERFFGTLERKGFHRLPGTTGSNSKDLKRLKPEKECIQYDITYEQIKELLEVLIAEYNNAPHTSLHNETPLQAMGRKLNNTCLQPYIIEEEKRTKIRKLTYFTVKRKVHGGLRSGKRPYIQYENAIYRNHVLTAGDSYVGQDLILVINPDDVSSFEAYTADGLSLGIMTAIGEYGHKSHSIKSRKAMASLSRQNKRANMRFTTPVTDYEEHLRQEAQTSRRAATNADILRREMGKPEVEEQLKEKHEIFKRPECIEAKEKSSNGTPMTISEFVTKFRAEHDGKMPTSDDFYELSKQQKTI